MPGKSSDGPRYRTPRTPEGGSDLIGTTRKFAKQLQQYSSQKHPTIRPLEQIRSGQELSVNQSTLQLSGFFPNFGNLLRRPGLGTRETTWHKSSDPDAYEVSRFFPVWARDWALVRATCESGGITVDKCREYGFEICLGIKNTTSRSPW